MSRHVPGNLEEVLFLIQGSRRLRRRRRRELASAIRSCGRWFGLPLNQIPAHPDALRQLFTKITAASVGVGRQRFANARSDLSAALRHAGVIDGSGDSAAPNTDWKCVSDSLENRYDRFAISRSVKYFAANGIAPVQIDEEASRQLLDYLTNRSTARYPRSVHQSFCRIWNRVPRGGSVALGPALMVPSYCDEYALPWPTFPSSLTQEIDAYLARQGCDDPFDLNAPPNPLRASTIKCYRHLLRQFASALVHIGHAPENITSLAYLVEVSHAKAGLRFVRDRRAGRQARRQAGNIAMLLGKIAKYWIVWPDSDAGRSAKTVTVQNITGFGRRLHGKSEGLSARARRSLIPFRDEKNIVRLFLLPGKLIKEVAQGKIGGRNANLLMQQAVALSILTYCPLRMDTLVALREDTNLRWTAPNMRGKLVLDIERGIVKNDLPLSFPLPDECADLVRSYLRRHRDGLLFPVSPFLFPSRDPAKHKQTSQFAVQLSRLIFEELGLRITPHTYRHIVHLVVLQRFPGAYAMIGRILGHTRLATTLRNYAHEDTAIALKLYQEMVGDEMAGRGIGHTADPSARAYALNDGLR